MNKESARRYPTTCASIGVSSKKKSIGSFLLSPENFSVGTQAVRKRLQIRPFNPNYPN